jgi:hypothetical protein
LGAFSPGYAVLPFREKVDGNKKLENAIGQRRSIQITQTGLFYSVNQHCNNIKKQKFNSRRMTVYSIIKHTVF